jgi:hypothetical protein
MADDTSPDDFSGYLSRNGLTANRLGPTEGKIYFVVPDYVVPYGRSQGKMITIAFPIPVDYPTTAPYGIHVRVPNNLTETPPNVQGSPLGGDWQFWSRRINDWPTGRRNARYYLDHVNRWLEGV